MFVKTDQSILDKKEYERRLILMKSIIRYEFEEVIRRYADKKEDFFFVDDLSLEIRLQFTEKAEHL